MECKVKNAIISVSDKTGLISFARGLTELGVQIYSTGGTAKTLQKEGINVTMISEYTGFPEILDGRVKSLHPKIHGGILAMRSDQSHMDQIKKNDIIPFDLVVINLYPFEKVIKKEGTSLEEAIENIDIGGPSMLRSAAKNYQWVCTICDPAYYDECLKELKQRGEISIDTRKKMARAVFEKTAYYDSIISSYFQTVIASTDEGFPETINIYFKKNQKLRYGENPSQTACFYTDLEPRISGVATAKKLWGKELSFNNILDVDSAFEIVKCFDGPACSVIKHTNPCGVAQAATLSSAFHDAWKSDPVSAFGSIVGFNRPVDDETAEEILKAGFVECIIAPGYNKGALKLLESKKSLRILEAGITNEDEVYDFDIKRVVGGVLIQQRDLVDLQEKELKLVTTHKANTQDLTSLLFAWKVAKWVKSNAIVLTKGTKTVGVGAGQMSRVDAAFMAVHKAGSRSKGSVMASDAFFPKTDAVELASRAGVRAIIQPGGSISDDDVIDMCNKKSIAMYFTGMRHFRH
ncbi:MAG: bifunctional phosphoribosylaminoimidazolecarboxamide formyltransferase/IMP cyclohydrolase [Spirochaetota bacterium]|nr:MAG: bifunctional phosphoribosylaminoimidazolecarboxamide formyltransferase/IMP cyclohydrolase [Spirochaetota bacterium]